MTAFHRFAILPSIVAFALVLGTPRSFVHAQPPEAGSGDAAPAKEAPAAQQDPDNEQFDALVKAEERYRGIAEGGGWPVIPEGEPMKPGERVDCARVEALEKRLAAEGYLASVDSGEKAPAAPRPAASGAGTKAGCEYGPALAGAVKEFQHDRYLAVDGVVGGQTQKQLAKPVADVLAKVDYALQRWRANGSNLSGSYILVNIPAFELALYEGRSAVLRMPVIVGMPDWPTPELSDKIDYIVVNPSWNIPKSIAEAEVLPKSRKDRGYFKREGIVADGDGTFSQKPGPRNPLGRLKFMMPNRKDIYLHDTPGKQKFASAARAFSHGCIRVEKPLDLAAYLLRDDAKWSKASIQAAISSGDSKDVKLPQPMAVHLLYMPAEVGEDGRLRVAPDIYDKVGNARDESASEPAPTEEDDFLPGP